jgi:hypothetical protein
MNARHYITEVQAFRRRVRSEEQSFCGASNVRGAREIGFGFGVAHFKQEHAGTGRHGVEKVRIEFRYEWKAAIQFQHGHKNTLREDCGENSATLFSQ